MTIASLLQSYGGAEVVQQARCLHAHLCEHSLHHSSSSSSSSSPSSSYAGSLLVQIYARCGSVQDACSVFHGLTNPSLVSANVLIKAHADHGDLAMAWRTFHALPFPDVVSWNAIISASNRNGHAAMAAQMQEAMLLQSVLADKVTILALLEAWASLGSARGGQKLHAVAGSDRDVVIGTAMVSFYGKLGQIDLAMSVFEGLDQEDTVSWNAAMSALAGNRCELRALELFHGMGGRGSKPNRVSYICAIGACSSLASRQGAAEKKMLEEGARIHAMVLGEELGGDAGVSTALLTMYGKCRDLTMAMSVFEAMAKKNVVASWNAAMGASIGCGKSHVAMALFGRMLSEKDVRPDKVSFLCVLDACSSSPEECQTVHSIIVEHGYGFHLEVSNKLISAYGICKSLSDAEAVFESLRPRDIVSWNAMLNAFARNGCIEAAHNLFLQMARRDSASWNTLISTFTEHGLALEALGLFRELCFDNNNGSEPNEVTFLCALDACSSLAELAGGELIHAVVSYAMHDDIDDALTNALINMYGKCGSLSDSLAVFGKKRCKEVVSWNAAIGAAALNGHGRIALELLSRMIVVDGKTPDGVTFACVLIACGFVGLLDEGKLAFLRMGEFGIRRSVDHYACLIDLLGRSGLMDEAECLIDSMPFNDVDAAWSCILGACHMHNDTERGIKAAAHCFQSGFEQCSSYVVLSNIYANAD